MKIKKERFHFVLPQIQRTIQSNMKCQNECADTFLENIKTFKSFRKIYHNPTFSLNKKLSEDNKETECFKISSLSIKKASLNNFQSPFRISNRFHNSYFETYRDKNFLKIQQFDFRKNQKLLLTFRMKTKEMKKTYSKNHFIYKALIENPIIEPHYKMEGIKYNLINLGRSSSNINLRQKKIESKKNSIQNITKKLSILDRKYQYKELSTNTDFIVNEKKSLKTPDKISINSEKHSLNKSGNGNHKEPLLNKYEKKICDNEISSWN